MVPDSLIGIYTAIEKRGVAQGLYSESPTPPADLTKFCNPQNTCPSINGLTRRVTLHNPSRGKATGYDVKINVRMGDED